MMSDESRWGSFWRRHIEKRRSFVCWSEMEFEREVMQLRTIVVHFVKKSVANLAEPTG
jgi:hypothetical protein